MKKWFFILGLYLVSCNTGIEVDTDVHKMHPIYSGRPRFSTKLSPKDSTKIKDINSGFNYGIDTTWYETFLQEKKTDYEWHNFMLYTKTKFSIYDTLNIYTQYNRYFYKQKDSNNYIKVIAFVNL